ncbi:MAG: DNA/RNA nuclease SfsA [Firmicutes bacterium]|nr:DNA/RNA nuclease SfsA [Bacillota bacterium]
MEPLPGDLKSGAFLNRINRFVAKVLVDNKEELAHVPSSGRMHELLTPGAAVFLVPSRGAGRKTRYSLCLVCFRNTLVSIDSLLPNRLVKSAFAKGLLPEFAQYTKVRPESNYNHSRFDFFLGGYRESCFVEVKSVTLVENGMAMFPDAPSLRAVKHLKELKDARENGFNAAVIFVIQRDDGDCFIPNKERDEAFASALKQAVSAGVGIYAYTCRVSLEEVELGSKVPVYI